MDRIHSFESVITLLFQQTMDPQISTYLIQWHHKFHCQQYALSPFVLIVCTCLNAMTPNRDTFMFIGLGKDPNVPSGLFTYEYVWYFKEYQLFLTKNSEWKKYKQLWVLESDPSDLLTVCTSPVPHCLSLSLQYTIMLQSLRSYCSFYTLECCRFV